MSTGLRIELKQTPSLSKKMTKTLGKALIFGCGYLGRRVAQKWLETGGEVTVTTRTPSKLGDLRWRGAKVVVADWNDRRSLQRLPDHDRILVAVAYDPRSGVGRLESQVLGLDHLLQATDPAADVCYISTTGVYHQDGGCWVDENSPCHPARAASRAHLLAESLLAQRRGPRLFSETPDTNRQRGRWVVLRLAGIYGPGRIPRGANVLQNLPIAADPKSFVNLIHVQDAAETVIQSWTVDRSVRQPCYVIADGHPVRRGDFYREIARLTGSPPPRFVEASENQPLTRRSEGNKRIWAERFRKDLLPTLQFPTFREGLQDSLAGLR